MGKKREKIALTLPDVIKILEEAYSEYQNLKDDIDVLRARGYERGLKTREAKLGRLFPRLYRRISSSDLSSIDKQIGHMILLHTADFARRANEAMAERSSASRIFLLSVMLNQRSDKRGENDLKRLVDRLAAKSVADSSSVTR